MQPPLLVPQMGHKTLTMETGMERTLLAQLWELATLHGFTWEPLPVRTSSM